MSPFQHGEVFVTDDGAETDLDLGHYEPFIETRMKKANKLHHRPDLQKRAGKKNAGATTWAKRCRSFPMSPTKSRTSSNVVPVLAPPEAVDVAIVEIGRHGGRHRVLALPRSGAPAQSATRPQQ